MSRPEDIPQDVWEAAKAVGLPPAMTGPDGWRSVLQEGIARAILAEREASAIIADERAAICADAVRLIEAGELYKDIPTARATEDCARQEAAHIARLIRREPGAIRKGGA